MTGRPSVVHLGPDSFLGLVVNGAATGAIPTIFRSTVLLGYLRFAAARGEVGRSSARHYASLSPLTSLIGRFLGHVAWQASGDGGRRNADRNRWRDTCRTPAGIRLSTVAGHRVESAVFGGCREATDAERASQKLLWCRGPETVIHCWLNSEGQRVKRGEPETRPAVRGAIRTRTGAPQFGPTGAQARGPRRLILPCLARCPFPKAPTDHVNDAAVAMAARRRTVKVALRKPELDSL